MSDEPAPPDTHSDRMTARITAGVAGLVLFLPVVYVLSIGPVARIVRAGGGPPPAWIEMFYAPLIWLHEYTFLRAPMEWYVELWTEGF